MSKRVGPDESALDYKIGEYKEKNGIGWVVIKSGKTQRWKRMKPMLNCRTAEEYFGQFNDTQPENPKYVKNLKDVLAKLKHLSLELAKHQIPLFKIGFYMVGNWSDYAWEDAEKKVKKISYVKEKLDPKNPMSIFKDVSYLFFTDHRRFWALRDGQLFISHNITISDKKLVVGLFEKYFGKKFVWNGRKEKNILISLK
jgi:hypothetical protein